MNTLEVRLGARSYPIHIGNGLLGRRDLLGSFLGGRRIVIVSNDRVAALHGAALQRALAGEDLSLVTIPDGESYKTLATLSTLFDALVQRGCGRDAVIAALGGGVVGDLAGFAAACYQRGVDFVQLPTTLLAQVDSSVGGKTAVNHPSGKNLIGAFHQPVGVIADTATLATLDERQFRAGLAEVIKYGLIRDAGFFAWLENSIDDLRREGSSALIEAIHRSCAIKAEIVADDEREQGQRALLNLGHTFGHAIETAAGYGEWLHGEAVAAGTMMAATLSSRLGLLAAEDVARIRRLFERAGLPVQPPAIEPERAMSIMGHDKKVRDGRIRLILLETIGRARVSADYSDEALMTVLRDYAR